VAGGPVTPGSISDSVHSLLYHWGGNRAGIRAIPEALSLGGATFSGQLESQQFTGPQEIWWGEEGVTKLEEGCLSRFRPFLGTWGLI
jgi:hypothetical protein